MITIMLYLLVGALTGILSGLLGIGGGVIIVPAFLYIFKMLGLPFAVTMHMAIAGSLAVMAVTAMMSCFSHHRRGNLDWMLVKKLLPGMVVGVLLGSSLAAMAKPEILELLFGILLLVLAVRLLFVREKVVPEGQVVHFPRHAFLFLITLCIGLCSGLLGVGGGVLIIPILTAFGVSMHRAAGASATLIIPVALVGTINFLIVGLHQHLNVPHSIGYLYLPAILFTIIGGLIFAPIGTALGARFKGHVLKKIYAVVLFVIGLHFLL